MVRMSIRPMYAHVGCSKTGTSSLQAGLWTSVDRLESADVGVPLVGRSAHRRRLLDPLGWQPARGFVGDWDDAALQQTRMRLAKARGNRVLVSNEDLVELPTRGVDRFLELTADAGLDLHLVVTLRDWAQQIPSEYQQFLRHGMQEPYLDFIRQVRDREGRWGTTSGDGRTPWTSCAAGVRSPPAGSRSSSYPATPQIRAACSGS